MKEGHWPRPKSSCTGTRKGGLRYGVATKVQDKCTERISRLAELGNELRRPEADYLHDGIYELRASYQGVHYRMLYCFSGKAVVVLSHGLTKEREVPPKELETTIKRKKQVEGNFAKFAVKRR